MNQAQESQNTFFPKIFKSHKSYSNEKEKTIHFFVTSPRKSWRKSSLITEEKVSLCHVTDVGTCELDKSCSYLMVCSFQIENLCPDQATSVHITFLPCRGNTSFLVDLFFIYQMFLLCL